MVNLDRLRFYSDLHFLLCVNNYICNVDAGQFLKTFNALGLVGLHHRTPTGLFNFMADQKNGFLLYKDLIHTVKKMSNEDAGLLFKHILEYVNDQHPEPPNFTVDLVFEHIKQQLKRDLQTWSGKRQDRSTAGAMGNLKRYNKDLYDKVKSETITLEEAIKVAKSRKGSQEMLGLANVAVNVNGNVNVNEIEKLKSRFIEIYPKGGNPMDIMAALSELLPEDQQKAVNHIPEYKKQTESSFYMKPVNYLNSYCWNDKKPSNENTIRYKELD